MKSFTTCLLATMFAFSLVATSSIAQPAQYQLVIQTQVKSGAAAQYEDYVRKIVEAADKVGGAQQWAAFQTTSGGPSGQYVVALPFNSYAERDGWTTPQQLLPKAFGEEEAAKIMRTGQASIAHSETFVTSHLETTGSPSSSISANYLVTRNKIKPEMIEEFELAIKKIWTSEAKAGGAPLHTMRRRIEGDRWVFHTITGFENGAARDKWPNFQKHMTASYSQSEIDQILDAIRSATVESYWFTITHRPDMSHAGTASSSNE